MSKQHPTGRVTWPWPFRHFSPSRLSLTLDLDLGPDLPYLPTLGWVCMIYPTSSDLALRFEPPSVRPALL